MLFILALPPSSGMRVFSDCAHHSLVHQFSPEAVGEPRIPGLALASFDAQPGKAKELLPRLNSLEFFTREEPLIVRVGGLSKYRDTLYYDVHGDELMDAFCTLERFLKEHDIEVTGLPSRIPIVRVQPARKVPTALKHLKRMPFPPALKHLKRMPFPPERIPQILGRLEVYRTSKKTTSCEFQVTKRSRAA